MTRKQRGETYDLNSARDRAAFEALLDRDGSDDDTPARRGGAAAGGSKKATAAREKRGKERFFRLRDEAAASRAPAGAAAGAPATPAQRTADLAMLTELLGGPASPLPADLISDVYDGHGGSLEPALDALLAMAGAAAASNNPAGASTSTGGGAGVPRSATVAAMAATSSACTAAEGSSWADLPPDVAFAVLSRLNPPELARLAATSRELRTAVRQLQRATRVLRVPPGLTFTAVTGMVRTHTRAVAVDLTRAVADPGHWATSALAPKGAANRDEGPSARRLRAAALEDQEARLQHLLLAVANGSSARRQGGGAGSGAPVSRVVTRGLEPMTDRVMADALGALRGLSSLDVSHCSRLTDKTWVLLGRYEATEDKGPAGDSSDDEGETDRFAGWQGWRDYAEGRAYGGADSSGNAVVGLSSSSSDGDLGDEGAGEEGDAATAAAVDAPAWAGRAAAAAAGMAALQIAAAPRAAVITHGASRKEGPKGLRTVCVRGCSGLTDHGARQLLGGPATKASLEELDVSRTGVTSAGLQLPPLGALRALNASHCRGLTALSLLLPPTHPLTTLDLTACYYLRELNITAAALTQLNIPACRTLYRLRLRTPRLEVLAAPQCIGLHSLFDDAWEAPKLRELNFFGCRQLSGSHLNTVLEGCTSLETLNVNGCWGLGALHLSACLELRSLDASGCRNLSALSAPSPLLSDLALVACGRLETLTLAPERPMKRLLLTNCGALRAVHAQPPHKAPDAAAAAAAGAKKRRGGGGGGAGQGLALGGCTSLAPEVRTRLSTLVMTV